MLWGECGDIVYGRPEEKTGILASVSMAQFILESGYGKSELAQNANNVFGMKCSLSRQHMERLAFWDGKSKHQADEGSRMQTAVIPLSQRTSANIRAWRIPSPTIPLICSAQRTETSSATKG